MNILGFLLEELYNSVEDKAGCDTGGNAVGQGHEDTGKESGNCVVQIGPVDFLNAASIMTPTRTSAGALLRKESHLQR